MDDFHQEHSPTGDEPEPESSVEPTFVIQTARRVAVPKDKGVLISVRSLRIGPVGVTYP